jgi:hypothetical protein
MTGMNLGTRILGIAIVGLALAPFATAQTAGPGPTADDLFRRNIGSTEQQTKLFPPHKIAGNVYYIGTESLTTESTWNRRA